VRLVALLVRPDVLSNALQQFPRAAEFPVLILTLDEQAVVLDFDVFDLVEGDPVVVATAVGGARLRSCSMMRSLETALKPPTG
jgi:hypothetical protein